MQSPPHYLVPLAVETGKKGGNYVELQIVKPSPTQDLFYTKALSIYFEKHFNISFCLGRIHLQFAHYLLTYVLFSSYQMHALSLKYPLPTDICHLKR